MENQTPHPTLKEIKYAVEVASGIPDISVKSRLRKYILARIAYYKIALEYDLSYSKIASEVNRSHATVWIAEHKIEQDFKTFPKLQQIYRDAKELIANNNNAITTDKESEYERKIANLKTMVSTLKAMLKRSKENKVFFDSLNDLTDEQIEGMKLRLDPYIAMCRADNAKKVAV